MRWFFSMKRTIVSPGGMPRLSNSSISDGRSSAFTDTSPRYTPTHCSGCSLIRRGRSFESISADFENSRSPLAILSGSLPRRDSIGFSGSVIRSSSLKRRCRLHHDLRQLPSSGRFWAEHDAESTALKCRRHVRDVRIAIDRGAHGPALPGNARAAAILPRSPYRRDSVLTCACFCRLGRRGLNAPTTLPATIVAQTNSVPGTTGCDRGATRSASRSPCAPNRWIQRHRPVGVPLHTPARPFVGQQVHLQNPPATAWTQQRDMLVESVLAHDVDGASDEFRRQRVLHHHRSVRPAGVLRARQSR